jgi:hypothetical protein
VGQQTLLNSGKKHPTTSKILQFQKLEQRMHS